PADGHVEIGTNSPLRPGRAGCQILRLYTLGAEMSEISRPRAARFKADFGIGDNIGVVVIWIILTIFTLGLALIVFPYYLNKDVLNKTKVLDAAGREIGRLNCRFNLASSLG